MDLKPHVVGDGMIAVGKLCVQSRSSPSKLFLYYATQWPLEGSLCDIKHVFLLCLHFPSFSFMILQCHNNIMISTKVLISRSDAFENALKCEM